ncbi:MAG: hypothetical protein HQL49_10365 [Gammaproteobacteria bacterium]|nr:hypothetical protein [Gammaproteobacteria bacterium]
MQFSVSEALCKAGKRPHDIFMISLGGQLLLGPTAIFLQIGTVALLLPLGFSLLFFLWSLWQIRQPAIADNWFVATHWRLALRRYRLLYIGYGITTLFFVAASLLALTIDPDSPQKFLPIALDRIGVMPTLILVLVTLVMENSALNMAQKGELPDSCVKRYPPPPGVITLPAADASLP